MIRYFAADDIREKITDIVEKLGMSHVDLSRVACLRSKGSSTKRTIARCHGLSKIVQLGMKTNAFYVIELLSERFDKLSEEEKTKTLIHELLHIPRNFGGGFRHHNFVCQKNIEKLYRIYMEEAIRK